MTVHSAAAPNAQAATRVNPVTAAVIHGALENIAIEMGHKLMRMAYSSIIRESEDFGAALTDPDGGQLCECKMSTPLQSGPIPGYVRGIRKELERRGETIAPGDVIMHNDPYGGASHGPDVAFCVPVFLEGQLIGFSVTTAHHLDIGASTPGSAGIVSAVDAYAEGLQFKAIKIVEEGRPNRAVWQLLRDNIRASDLVVGDMEAQIKAAEIGAERFLALAAIWARDPYARLPGSHGLFRAPDAQSDPRAAGRRLRGRDDDRRLPGRRGHETPRSQNQGDAEGARR
jgi:N-methylhydantoinase B